MSRFDLNARPRKCPKFGSTRLLLRSVGETTWTFRQRVDGVFERDDITEPEINETGARLECVACENQWPINWRTNGRIVRVGSQ